MSALIGSVVQLKSGGPKMTVYDNTVGMLSCVWVTSHGEVMIWDFDIALLNFDRPSANPYRFSE